MAKGIPVKIESGGLKTGGSLVIDGVDMSHFTESLSLDMGAGIAPRLTVNLVGPVLSAALEAEVAIPEPTADLLLKLGWTPPAAETEGD